MNQSRVSIVRYKNPLESVRKAVALSRGLDHLMPNAKVFIKPNIVFWTRATVFPKWGVITTSRVVEDIVMLLKEKGIHDITIGEGSVTMDPKDRESQAHAYETLGYNVLKKRYGVRCINVFERPFQKIDLGEGIELKFNTDILNSDFVVNLPVLKAHNLTRVSLGIKNIKGMIDIPSRKKCHSADPERDLNFMIARIADRMPPMFTLQDGIFTNERGPGFDGKIHRTNLLVASADVLSADMVGARVLGHDPAEVPHLVHAAKNHRRPLDLSDVVVVGERIDDVASYHEYDFKYTTDKDCSLPVPLAKQGLKGIYYRKYDFSMCTYCSGINGLVLSAIRYAWNGEPWNDVEVLTGKLMRPTPGRKKTILLGKCIYQANKDHPDIREMIPIKGCPPKIMDIHKALSKAGIAADSCLFENFEQLPGLFMGKYQEDPEFDEAFFKIK